MLFTWQTLEVVLVWSFVCSIDGCIIASASFGATRGFKPTHWAAALGTGHFALGSLGVLLSGIVAYFVSGVSLGLSLLAIVLLLYWMIRDKVRGHSHQTPVTASLLLAGLAFSGDAVPQGVAMHGHLSHGHGHEVLEVANIVGAGLLATFAIGWLVALYSFLAVIGVRVLSRRIARLQAALPAVGFGLLVYLWLSMGHEFGEALGWELSFPPLCIPIAAILAGAGYLLTPGHIHKCGSDCSH